jgi:hypothetical protein
LTGATVAGREHGSASRVGFKNILASEAMEEEPAEHLTTTEAREGVTPHVTRYVLGWGLGLVIVIFVILLIIY